MFSWTDSALSHLLAFFPPFPCSRMLRLRPCGSNFWHGAARACRKIAQARRIDMHFKLLVVFVEDRKTEALMSAARESGATGCTVIHHARGEGAKKQTSFFGMSLSAHRDVLLMIVEEHLSRRIMAHLREGGALDA